MLDKQLHLFDNSPSLLLQKNSLCQFADYEPDEKVCIDERQEATDSGHANILRHTIIRGVKGKYVDTTTYYYIDTKITKIIVRNSVGGLLKYDSEIYLEQEKVVLQKDKLAKINAANFIQEAISIKPKSWKTNKSE
ncbi:MAG: hypothetical protein EOP48_26345 [Sphingobacteriales bacterium]|nr:MAG: hypothetical protein EOP48_26345 [Sphingobacteriales bacterium]